MVDPKLPHKPAVPTPRVQDAKKAHRCLLSKQDTQAVRNKGDKGNKRSQESEPSGQPPRIQISHKRKASNDSIGSLSRVVNKRLRISPSSSDNAKVRHKPIADMVEEWPVSLNNFSVPKHASTSNAPPFLRWDRATGRFVIANTVQTCPALTQATSPLTETQIPTRKRKRSHVEEVTIEQNERRLKRLKTNNCADEVEAVATATTLDKTAKWTHSNIPSYYREKPLSDTCLNMRLKDLIPHNIPNSENFAQAKAREKTTLRAKAKQVMTPKAAPPTFMDLPTEIRQNIWDKVFEGEAYKFTIKKDCKRDLVSDMVPTPPPSSSCLFIHPTLAVEVAEQMYKSMRVEIDFGRLRPAAMRNFMNQIGQSRLGREAHRVCFIRALDLHKVNMGLFAKAREIVSANWTVYGDTRTDEQDYLNNHIDPLHVLNAPPSAPPKQKGLKERRLWKEQEMASQRYKRHMEGWCHPQADDPNQTVQSSDPNEPDPMMIDVPVQVHNRPCPFNDKCLNLKDTKFCMAVKYKFGCIKGRYSRHKEAFFDFYPQTGKIELVRTPKSKFYYKAGN